LNNQNKTIKNFINLFIPPPYWQLTVIITLGIFFGIGFYIIYISNALSYLSDDPNACINCHVMNPQYATWQRGSHGRVTNCNDCHVPHDNFIRKYTFKANDGLRHATYFTLRWEPQVIRIKEAGIKVVQENCIRCHENIIHKVSLKNINLTSKENENDVLCWSCHRGTPHGTINSLSSTPYARVPKLSPVIPDWLNKFLKSKVWN
jgi:cytochrome c nitrite reductase small subunit